MRKSAWFVLTQWYVFNEPSLKIYALNKGHLLHAVNITVNTVISNEKFLTDISAQWCSILPLSMWVSSVFWGFLLPPKNMSVGSLAMLKRIYMWMCMHIALCCDWLPIQGVFLLYIKCFIILSRLKWSMLCKHKKCCRVKLILWVFANPGIWFGYILHIIRWTPKEKHLAEGCAWLKTVRNMVMENS